MLDPGSGMLDSRYIIGVDLGTTNLAVAYVDLGVGAEDAAAGDQRAIQPFEIPQLVAEGVTATRSVLPSFLYLPGQYDLPEGGAALPWDADRAYVVGEFAREQGARVPGRLATSAKSWLCHAGVDRTAAILPWGANAEVAKVSPVEASRRYLQHIREAWDAVMAGQDEERAFGRQLIVVTVPASFDEVARELTVRAAREAGIPRLVLLEEPMAAFYAWLSAHEENWRQRMRDGQLVLVCDVGGGTTDFSVVGIREGATGLRFDRLAVGEHLLLGGDNMDLALGRYMESKMVGQPGKLDAQRWPQLVYACRSAKERLLGASTPEQSVDITVMGAAGRLIGGTLKASLSQDEVRQLILDGFFPQIGLDAATGEARRTGLTELGLPYVQDAAITRHLATFWRNFREYLRVETGRATPYPDYLLFNGGALIPAGIRHRIHTVVREWFRPVAGVDWSPAVLSNPRPDLAVAVGAAYYGLVRLGKGVRIGSGSPRAYYVGVEADRARASEGDAAGQVAVCLAPRGMEEGFDVRLAEAEFAARTNQPVEFQLFTSSTRLGDRQGDVVQLAPDEVSVLPPIRTVLRFGKKGEARQLPVQLSVRLTEIGTLELWCESKQSAHRWQLQFDIRHTPAEEDAPAVAETVDQAAVERGQMAIRRTFSTASNGADPPQQMRKSLESLLDLPKEGWSTALIRQFADTLIDVGDARSRSPEHEVRWLNLLGYCLRPGFGDPLDEWRMKQIWKLHFQGPAFARAAQNRAEWWIFWRRVAGGLKAGQQIEIYHQVRGALQSSKKRKSKPGGKLSGHVGAGEEVEIWMALANFEWLSADVKLELGELLLARMAETKPKPQELWALSRFGARNAIYGPSDRLIPSSTAAEWVHHVFRLNLEPSDSLAHAVVVMARYTGDRTRDVPHEVRQEVAAWLSATHSAERYRNLLTDPHSSLSRDEQDWMFGESLPAGLALSAAE